LKPSEVKSPKDAVMAVRFLIEDRESLNAEIDDLKRRLEFVENDQGFLSKREPPRIPKFPKVLRLYGIVPPEEREAS
jgi:hypothetical protein